MICTSGFNESLDIDLQVRPQSHFIQTISFFFEKERKKRPCYLNCLLQAKNILRWLPQQLSEENYSNSTETARGGAFLCVRGQRAAWMSWTIMFAGQSCATFPDWSCQSTVFTSFQELLLCGSVPLRTNKDAASIHVCPDTYNIWNGWSELGQMVLWQSWSWP